MRRHFWASICYELVIMKVVRKGGLAYESRAEPPYWPHETIGGLRKLRHW